MPMTFLLSHQRSGSHFLKNALESRHATLPPALPFLRQRKLQVLPELLSPENGEYHERGDWVFAPFLRERQRQDPAVASQPDGIAAAFNDYLAGLGRRSGADIALGDVKLNQLHAVSGAYQEIGAAPAALYGLLVTGKIVFLRRRNLVRAVFSGLSAAAANEWHRKGCERGARPPLPVNAAELLQFVKQLDLGLRMAEEWLAPYLGYKSLFIDYEDLLEPDGACRDAEFSRIAEFLGVGKGTGYRTEYRKTGVESLALGIANFAEVAETFRGTPYEAMLDSASAEGRRCA